MAVMRGLRDAGPVPVFAAAGADRWGEVQELRGRADVALTTTPRHASVLLVAGTIADAHATALRRVHDQLPRPRAVVGWRRGGAAGDIPVTDDVDGVGDALAEALRGAHARVHDDPSTGADDLLPDTEPNEWRGVGPYGQGGQGMMGGTPYGRPMAMTGDDRDGLALDRLSLPLGPFLDAFPPGLVLDVVLQGEVLQSATPKVDGSGASPDDHAASRSPGDRRRRYLQATLRWLSHALHVEGLDALAARAAVLATDAGRRDPRELAARIGRLRRLVRRSGVLWSLRSVGRLDDQAPAHLRGDAVDRWRRRLDALAAAAGDDHAPDGPTGHPLDPDDGLLPTVLAGLTLTDAVSTIVSLDIRVPQARRAAVA